MIKEIKENTSKWKNKMCSCIGKFSIVKLLKTISILKVIVDIVPNAFFPRKVQIIHMQATQKTLNG
jgi:hypothetical protein